MALSPLQVRWHTREASGLKLDRELAWWHDGERIAHPKIIEAFNRGVRVRPDGRYVLEFAHDWCFLEVEDCGFAVLAIAEVPGPGLAARLSDGTVERLELTTLAVDVDGALTVGVKQGLGRARLTRTVHLELGQRLVAQVDGTVVAMVGAQQLPTSLPASTLEG